MNHRLAVLSQLKIVFVTWYHIGVSEESASQGKILLEFFRIEFYKIYRIYRICRKLFLVVLKMKITTIVFYKFYRFCRNCWSFTLTLPTCNLADVADINTHTFGTSQAQMLHIFTKWTKWLSPEFMLATAREGNAFTGVCQSFCSQLVHGYSVTTHPCWLLGLCSSLLATRSLLVLVGYLVTAHPCYGPVGTHPTGMLSCSILIFETIEFLQPTHNVLLRHHKLIGGFLPQ